MARRRNPLDVVQVIRRTRRSRPIALRRWMGTARKTRGVRAVPADAWAPPGIRYEPGDVEAKDGEGRWSHAFRWRAPGEIEVVTSAELAIARETGELDRHPIVRAAGRLATKLGAELVEEERADAAIAFGAGEWVKPVADDHLRVATRVPLFRFETAADQPPITLEEWRSVVERIRGLRWLDESSQKGVWRYGAALRRPGRHPNQGRLFQWCYGSVVIQRDTLFELAWLGSDRSEAISVLCRRIAEALRAEIHAADGSSPTWATAAKKPRRGLAR